MTNISTNLVNNQNILGVSTNYVFNKIYRADMKHKVDRAIHIPIHRTIAEMHREQRLNLRNGNSIK